jgi:hypothetical protein
VNAFGCIAPPIDGATLPKCLRHLDDGDSVVSIYRPDQIRCLVEAGADCAAARACLGYTVGPCSPDGDRCEGDNLVECSHGTGLTLDCRGGLWFTDDTTCVPASSVGCGLATCTDGTPSRCDGTRAVSCRSGVLQAFDCAQAGLTCTIDGDAVGCAGTGAACTASRCDGTTAVLCGGGHEQRYACAAMFDGGTCLDYGREGVSCGFGPDCGGTATCDGNVATLCVLGAQVSVDCVAAGFRSCALGSCIPATFP